VARENAATIHTIKQLNQSPVNRWATSSVNVGVLTTEMLF